MTVSKKGFLETKLQAIYLAWLHLYKNKMYVCIFIFMCSATVTRKIWDTTESNDGGYF